MLGCRQKNDEEIKKEVTEGKMTQKANVVYKYEESF